MAVPKLLRAVIGMVMVAVVMVANCPVVVEAADHNVDPPPGKKQFVLIQNNLPGDLNVHCWSSEDDLQPRTMAHGAEYKWTFDLNWKATTTFVCRFDIVGTNMWQSFKVYKGPGFFISKSFPCQQCIWMVNPDGFFRAQEGKPFGKIYPWLQGP